MAKMSYREALTETLHQEMANDENVIVMGEDVVGGTGSPGGPEAIGGVFGVTGGLYGKFGAGRVIDMPISEAGIAGTAAGAALAGKRPVAEIMFADFIGLCMDQLMNQAAKFRYMFGGKATCPMVLRTSYGAGMQAASQHSQSPHPMVTAIPGLKVAMPSTAADAKGLLTTAIRDDDPTIFFEHKALYGLHLLEKQEWFLKEQTVLLLQLVEWYHFVKMLQILLLLMELVVIFLIQEQQVL